MSGVAIATLAMFEYNFRLARTAHDERALGSPTSLEGDTAHSKNGANTDVSPMPNPNLGKSSIAVLPFRNASDHGEDDCIGMGIAGDIIAGLARVRSFFVIAPESTFQFQERQLDVREIAKELGVQYVVEGSVKKAGENFRVIVQLVDGSTGYTLWSEKYDKNYSDMFQIQDDLVNNVVAQIEPELHRAQFERLQFRSANQLGAWELYYKGLFLLQRHTVEDLKQASLLFETAIHQAPSFALGHAGLAIAYRTLGFQSSSTETYYDKALVAALRAVELDDRDARCYVALSYACLGKQDFSTAIYAAEKAIQLTPSSFEAYLVLATCLVHQGESEKALPLFHKTMALNPADPAIGRVYGRIAFAHLCLKQYQATLDWAQRSLIHKGGWPPRVFIIAALSYLGRVDEAKVACAQLKSLKPEISISYVRQQAVTSNDLYAEHLLNGLRLASLPEQSTV